jgi:hypothetical protein
LADFGFFAVTKGTTVMVKGLTFWGQPNPLAKLAFAV